MASLLVTSGRTAYARCTCNEQGSTSLLTPTPSRVYRWPGVSDLYCLKYTHARKRIPARADLYNRMHVHESLSPHEHDKPKSERTGSEPHASTHATKLSAAKTEKLHQRRLWYEST